MADLPADARAIRSRAMQAVVEMAAGDGVCIAGVSSPEVGPPVRWGVAQGAAKALFERATAAETSGYVLRTVDLRLARPIDCRSFRNLGQLGDRARMLESPAWEHLYAPARLRDQARVLLTHGREITALVSVVRGVGAPLFDRTDARVLRPLVEPLRLALNAADALERDGAPRGPADLVLDPQGRVRFASLDAQAWLRVSGFREHLARLVRDADRERAPRLAHGAARIDLVRIHGEGGRIRYLARVTAAAPLRLAPASQLTPAQREVAELLVAGATLSEVARMTSRSLETVRSHLKTIYLSLGVSNRVELASALEGDES